MKKLIVVMIPILALTGCATGRVVGTGTVTGMQQVAAKDYRPGKGTGVGAGVGAGGGAAAGAAYGAAGCAAVSLLTFGLATPACIPFLAMTTAVGAGAGAAVGSTSGYIADVHKRGKGLYQYSIRVDHQRQPLYVTQYLQQPIIPGDRVRIYSDGKNNVYIKK